MNSRRKGKVGELEFAGLLREHGFDARRGQQFSGGVESPDVVAPALAWLHFEVKRVQNLNLTDACVQAEGDSAGKPWVVAHRRNHAPWLITMRAEFFFELLREFEARRGGEQAEPAPMWERRATEWHPTNLRDQRSRTPRNEFRRGRVPRPSTQNTTTRQKDKSYGQPSTAMQRHG